MAGTQQQIALSLVAQLDQGNIQAEVSSMAQQMSQAIEASFESLGQKIAQKILQGGMAGLSELSKQIAGGAGSAPFSAYVPQVTNAPTAIASPQNATTAPQQFSAGPAMPVLRAPNVTPQLPESIDIAVQQARAFNAIREGGGSVSVSPEQQKLFENAERMIDQSLSKELQALNQNIKDLDQGIKDQSQVQKDARRIAENVTALSGARDQIQGVTEPEAEKSGGLGRILRAIGGIGLIGRGAQELSALPTTLMQREAAGAELQNIQSRSLMRGDIGRSLAVERLGGQGDLEAGAQTQAMGQTLGTAAAAAISGALVAGPLGAILAGGGTLAYQALRMPQQAQGIANERIQAEMGRSAEYFQFAEAGQNQAVRSFQAARGIGAPELTNFLTGENYIQGAARQGLGLNEVNQTLQTLGRATPNYPGRTPMIEGMAPQVQDILGLQAKGFSAAPEATAAMMQTAPQTEQGIKEAISATKDLITDGIARGMDSTSMNRAIQQMSQSVQSQGMGAGGLAQIQMQRAIEAARQTAAPGENIGQRALMGADLAQNLMRSTQGGGLAGAAGFEAAHGTSQQLRRMGINLPETFIQQFGATLSPRSIQEAGRMQHVNVTDEQARSVIESHQQRQAQGLQQTYGRFGRDVLYSTVPSAAGAQTADQALIAIQQLGAQAKMGANLGLPIGQIPSTTPPMNAAESAGAQQNRIITESQAQTVTSGIQLLGTTLDGLNRSLSGLIDRANTVLTKEGLRPNSPSTPTFVETGSPKLPVHTPNRAAMPHDSFTQMPWGLGG